MAGTLVSGLLGQLGSIAYQHAEQEITLVAGDNEEVKKLESKLRTIKAVLNDAEQRQVNEKAVEVWLEKLKHASYDMDDVLDEWNTELSKLQIDQGVDNAPAPKKRKVSLILSTCSFFVRDQFNKFVLRRDIANKIKDINETLDEIAKEREMFKFELNGGTEEIERPKTTSLVDVSTIIGRDSDKVNLVNNLLGRGSQEGRSHHPHVISLVGMGGLGKTTLAQQAYNDVEVKAHFDIRMWVCVSDPFDQINVAKAIIQDIERESINNVELQTLLQRIRNLIVGDFIALETLLQSICILVDGKKFFLVLDDLWTEDEKKWEPFKLALSHGAQGSRILVTTRKVEVAEIMDSVHTFYLGLLSNEDCWWIFSKIAFSGKDVEQRKILEDVGRKIAFKCKGLPLAAKTLGSLMRFKKTLRQWQDVLHSRVWEFEKSQKDLFTPLLLSYFDLPSPVKRCFTYCAIFPKDYEFNREEMVQLWMAQGYLNSTRNMEMEITGQEYFEMLAMRSFFQDFKKDEDGSITECKMHDIVHDQAQSLMKNECFHTNMIVDETKELETNSFHEKLRHLMLTIGDGEQVEVPAFIYMAKNLRTLLIQSKRYYDCKTLLLDLFRHLTSLRTLDLSHQSLEEVPKEVKSLIHLRYLNLSRNVKLKELPETLCDLYNLQILNVSSCTRLEKLPQGMGKLRNLRHLILHGVYVELPNEFGRLSSLITFTNFVAGGNDNNGGGKLGELKNLNHLRGKLKIEGLKNLTEVYEAKNAQLKEKIHLRELSLIFDQKGKENRKMANDEALLNALEPHLGLEYLNINFYHGTTVFRNWSMCKLKEVQFLQSIKLKTLLLHVCDKLECLPPLGRLPFLESLMLICLSSVKKVSVEFLGVETIDESSSSLEFFPNLKELNIQSWKMWEEWDGIGEMRESWKMWKEWDGIGEMREEDDLGVTIMPRLHKLEISWCPKLKALPHFLHKTPLNKLFINKCPILEQRCKRGTGEDWPKISHIPNIKIYGEYVQINGR